MNVKEIIEKWLTDNGYDGLYNDEECGCQCGDLFPCDGPVDECRPGHLIPIKDGEGTFFIGRRPEDEE
jgi:hypothetical protein